MYQRRLNVDTNVHMSDVHGTVPVPGSQIVGKTRKQKHFFLAPSSQGRSCVPSSGLLCAGNLVNIRSTQKLSWISLFHARGRRMPSFWVIGKTRFESVDIICQIWPIRGYTRSWYTGTGRLKKWNTGSAASSPLSFIPFYFRLRALSIQQLSRSPGQAKGTGKTYQKRRTTTTTITTIPPRLFGWIDVLPISC